MATTALKLEFISSSKKILVKVPRNELLEYRDGMHGVVYDNLVFINLGPLSAFTEFTVYSDCVVFRPKSSDSYG
jgi:hypothetical protein